MVLAPLSAKTLSDACRTASEKMENLMKNEGTPVKILTRNNPSPLRPKRFRKVFGDACDYVGVTTDIRRLFMGKKDDALHACNYARIAWYIDTYENQDTWWVSA